MLAPAVMLPAPFSAHAMLVVLLLVAPFENVNGAVPHVVMLLPPSTCGGVTMVIETMLLLSIGEVAHK